MNFTKKELNETIQFVCKFNIKSIQELIIKSNLCQHKISEIYSYLQKKHNSSNFELTFSSINKRISSKKNKTLKSKRTLIENKYNEKLSSCWN